ncbi:DUF2645 family protein [Franconibacter pulveris 601]|uniref:DUF2645 family protein n=1 Tax=Franconibacter pulveris TaxID=435910 RepID=UPI000462F5B9|nr:DUF2645 family protein [Franconibacter pulveris]
MNFKKITLTLFYSLFAFTLIAFLSYLKEEEYIDGDEVKNVCDAVRMLQVDDPRAFTASLGFLLLMPLLIACLSRKHRHVFLIVVTIALFFWWVWRFYGRLAVCL